MQDQLTRATAYFNSGAFSEAERVCREALKTNPNQPLARVLLGRVLWALGQADAAQQEFQAVTSSHPAFDDAWLRWAQLLQAYGHPKKAAEYLQAALRHCPLSFAIHNDLGLILLALDDSTAAARHLEQALEITPRSEIALCNLAIVRKKQGRFDDAVASCRSAIAINPNLPEAHSNLGDLLKERDAEAAIASFLAALNLRPDYPEALDNLGTAYFFQGRLPEALEKFDRAQNLQPRFNRAVNHKTTALLLMGRLREAWPLYRRRFELAGLKRLPHGRFPVPVWTGEPLAGKRLLVWTEQGLGEEILQAGMFGDALKIAARVTIECSPRLLELFTRSFPDATIISRDNPSRASTAPIEADLQIAGGDLGAAFRNDWSDFPHHTGYLKADPVLTARLRQKYQSSSPGKLVVGLSWASQNANMGKDKTLPLSAFAPLLREKNVVFVNLQYAASPDEVQAVEKDLGIEILTDETVDLMGDMDGVAAQIAAMDLVISVSNTAVHMAGALNVPVWNIVPGYNVSSMWHWFHGREDSPWYPAMKIYRRTEADSGALMVRLAADLRGFRDRSLGAAKDRP